MASSREPVILEVAINGQTSKAINPRVPHTPDEIAADAIECLSAGAAIIHNHIDALLHSETAADRYAEGWRAVLAEFPDAILCSTSTRAPTRQEKWRHVELLAERGMAMGVLDPGSVNLADSDENGLPGSRASVYANPADETRYVMELLARVGLGPSVAIYEPGFLRTLLAYERAGRLAPGALCKLYFGGDYNWFDGRRTGASFGLPPTATALAAYLEMMVDSAIPWCVAVIGGDVVESGLARHALERGGHLRVGLEDRIGEDQPSNRDLLERAVALCAEVGRPVATRQQTREILGLRR